MGMFGKRNKAVILKVVAVVQLTAVGLSGLLYLKSSGGPETASFTEPAAAAAPTVRTPSPPSPRTQPWEGGTVVQGAAMLPARLLDCSLGRITNFDRNKQQKPSEYVFDGQHAFKLFLPSVPVRTTPPPQAPLPPDPVDPKTRIVSDPDDVSGEAKERAFDRVVDLWPNRVEMTTPINNVVVNLIVVDGVDVNGKSATMFMTRANDAVTFDMQHLYYGKCKFDTKSSGEGGI